MLVIELANYQLLELRVLDRVLEDQLAKAEDDIRRIFFKSKFLRAIVNKRLAKLFRLRYDMIFLWENLENVSKIIGDYYLAELYRYLSDLFKLDQWSKSIRRRFKVLDDIYTTAKSDFNERLLLILELLIIIIFLFDLFLVILGLVV